MAPSKATDTTERIGREAVRLFARSGFGSTTIDEIAAAAEVGVATFYRRWPDKAALADDLFAEFLDDMESVMTMPDGPTAKQRFLRVWADTWAFATADPDRFVFFEAHVRDPWVSPSNQRRKTALTEAASALMRQVGVRAPADLAHAMMTGTLITLLRMEETFDSDEVGERLWQALRTA